MLEGTYRHTPQPSFERVCLARFLGASDVGMMLRDMVGMNFSMQDYVRSKNQHEVIGRVEASSRLWELVVVFSHDSMRGENSSGRRR